MRAVGSLSGAVHPSLDLELDETSLGLDFVTLSCLSLRAHTAGANVRSLGSP